MALGSLEELNDLFGALAERVANRRDHAETLMTALAGFEAGGPPRQVDSERLVEAFRWSVTRKVTRTATVPAEGNAYAVDPSLVGRRVELRYDPEDLIQIAVYFEERRAGTAAPFVVGRHVYRAVPQATRPVPPPTGADFLQMVAGAHDEEAGIAGFVDFSQLQMFGADIEEER